MAVTRSKRALVIEDQAAERALICTALARLGWDVDAASDGHHGCLLFSLKHHQLVVVDIFMPVRDGLETIKLIRARDRDTTILAVSGGGAAGCGDYLPVARRFGADFALAKPFTTAALVRLISDHSPAAADGDPEVPEPL